MATRPRFKTSDEREQALALTEYSLPADDWILNIIRSNREREYALGRDTDGR